MSLPAITSRNIGAGIPLVLLHAFPLSHMVWKDIKAPAGYRLILPDFPGFGLSPLAPTGLSLEDAAKGLQKNLEESGVNVPVVLGGISMGGYWALEFIRQFPSKIRSLILVSTRTGLDKPEARQKRLDTANKVEKEGTVFLAEAMIPGLLGQTTINQNKGLVQTVSQWIREASPPAVALAQRAMANRRDQTPALHDLKLKTLIIAGKEDALIPYPEAESMAKLIPNSVLRLLDKVGHLIPLESPEEFQKSLNEFLLH